MRTTGPRPASGPSPAPDDRQDDDAASALVARLDRLPKRAVSFAATGIAGLCLFVIFYGNFNINASFIQTCRALDPACSPESAPSRLVLPVSCYLVGYAVGGLFVAPLSDRFGRRRALSLTLCFTVLGSLLSAAATNYGMFVLSRAITGIGMGATLPVANTYIGELAPAKARASYTARTFVLCTVGAVCGIGFGTLLTTPPAPFPEGLPFTIAGPGFESGWRVLYGIAVVIGAIAVLATTRLPESPRWLLAHGPISEAERVVSAAEKRALRRGTLPEPDPTTAAPPHAETSGGYRDLLTHRRYRRRLLLLVAVWFTGYATVFGYSTGSTVVLAGLGFTAPVAGMISSVGGIGFLAQGLFSARYSESLERRYWLPVGAATTALGAVLIGALGEHIVWAFLGSFLVFFGFNVWVPPTFALSAESFPTGVRSAGFGLVDGLGVLGGAVGVLVIAPLVSSLRPLPALLLLAAPMVLAALLAQFAPRARNRTLEELSP